MGKRGDPWLQRWLPLIAERAAAAPVLELGCGTGRDTATLSRAGHRVIAVDISTTSIAAAKLRVPSARFHRQDIRERLPVDDGGAGVVVASLCFHYFDWAETLALVAKLRDTLRPTGVLLCRLNSTNDRNFGAAGHKSIAENFYSVLGKPKRFFDRKSVDELFGNGWNMLHAEEVGIDRYLLPKAVWEMVLEKDA